jgi:hypothetical protein
MNFLETIGLLALIALGSVAAVIVPFIYTAIRDRIREHRNARILDAQFRRSQMYATLSREHRIAEWCED